MLLLDAYPRVCATTEASKIIFRPDGVQDTNMLPHYLSCSDPMGVQHQADTGLFRYLLPAYQVCCQGKDAGGAGSLQVVLGLFMCFCQLVV